MEQKIVVRYSISFKMQVIEDIERGQFNMKQARDHHGIKGDKSRKT